MDSGLDQNQAKLRVLVLAIAFQVLADLDRLLDEHVQVLWNFGSKTVGLQDAYHLLSGNGLDLGDSIRVTQDDTDLRGGQTLLGEFADVVLDIGGRDLEPRGGGASVGEGTLGDTLSGSMHTTHGAAEGVKLSFSGHDDSGNSRQTRNLVREQMMVTTSC